MTRDEKIDAMLDKHDITELLYAYCNAADRHDHVKMRSLYHEDAIDDHGSFFKGPAMEFIDKLPEIQAPMEILHHNITSINIALDGDYAEGEVYMIGRPLVGQWPRIDRTFAVSDGCGAGARRRAQPSEK